MRPLSFHSRYQSSSKTQKRRDRLTIRQVRQTNEPGHTFLAKDGVHLNETGKKRLAMALAN
uniref:SGNH hydrolase-type esterase domain-containing protein n=1 Tax=Romanomermis culicivorax TaxID=13658 RepID=A0A915KS21_ROMCU